MREKFGESRAQDQDWAVLVDDRQATTNPVADRVLVNSQQSGRFLN
jgi:hypothetical protein